MYTKPYGMYLVRYKPATVVSAPIYGGSMDTIAHDGQGWRLAIRTLSDDLELRIEQADDARWLTTQLWTIPIPPSRHRRAAIAESAREHGWITSVERWPKARRDGTQILNEPFPFDWELILREATELRRDTLEQARRSDLAWRHVLSDAAAKGVRPQQLMEATGLSRATIFRVSKSLTPLEDADLLRAAQAGKGS